MAPTFDSLTDDCLDEAIMFLRSANPFCQDTWGWDTGRFIDWRWAANVLRAEGDREFFARHGTIVRDNGDAVALVISEVGGDDHCVLTTGQQSELLARALAWLIERHDGKQLIVYPSDAATWVHTVLVEAGFAQGDVAGQEWSFNLRELAEPGPAPEGFSIDSLSDDRNRDFIEIDRCLEGAFGGARDRVAMLRSLATNPMFRPELNIVARSGDGRIAAYCRGTVDPISGVCGIDPVATHADYQGRGLGKAILRACFAAQARLGGTTSYIGSAPEPSPGSRLYRSLGPTTVTSHSTWAKQIR